MLITPITTNNDFKRYQKLDTHTVVDTVLNKIYTTDNADELINKIKIVGKINADNIDNGGNGKLLDVNV